MTASTAASHSPSLWGVGQPFFLLPPQAAQGGSSFVWGTPAIPASPHQLSLSQHPSALPSPRPVPIHLQEFTKQPFEPQQLVAHSPVCLLHQG